MKGVGGGAPHLEDVAIVLVDDQASKYELGVEHEAAHREALGVQLLHRVVVRTLLPHLHLVVDQRVVHVVPDALDVLEVERTRAEDAARRSFERRPRVELQVVQHPRRFIRCQQTRRVFCDHRLFLRHSAAITLTILRT